MSRDLWWITSLALVLVAGGIWWLTHSRHPLVTPARPTPIVPDDVQIRLSKVHLHGVSNGKVVWEAEVDDFDMSKSRPVLRIHGLKNVSVLNQGKQELTVNADTMEKNIVTGDILLNGNVNVDGDKLQMRTQNVVWEAQRGILRIPVNFSAQIGDYALTVDGNTSYDALKNTLLCSGPVVATTKGNVIHAGGAQVDVLQKCVTLYHPVKAEFDVADMQDWSEGRNVPKVPSIPVAVQERYREYCIQNRLPLPGALTNKPMSSPDNKGVRP